MLEQENISMINEKGWAVIDACDFSKLDEFRVHFGDISKRFLRNIDGIPDYGRLSTNELPENFNPWFRAANYELLESTELLLDAFADTVESLSPNGYFYQRRPYLRANVPGVDHTPTPPHSDVFFGHSPHAFVFWVPMHDVSGEDGLYFFDADKSQNIIDNYCFEEPLEQFLEDKSWILPPPVKVKFGQALVFMCGLIHGAIPAKGKYSRLSFDLRVQPANTPLFEKGMELYSFREKQ